MVVLRRLNTYQPCAISRFITSITLLSYASGEWLIVASERGDAKKRQWYMQTRITIYPILAWSWEWPMAKGNISAVSPFIVVTSGYRLLWTALIFWYSCPLILSCVSLENVCYSCLFPDHSLLIMTNWQITNWNSHPYLWSSLSTNVLFLCSIDGSYRKGEKRTFAKKINKDCGVCSCMLNVFPSPLDLIWIVGERMILVLHVSPQ